MFSAQIPACKSAKKQPPKSTADSAINWKGAPLLHEVLHALLVLLGDHLFSFRRQVARRHLLRLECPELQELAEVLLAGVGEDLAEALVAHHEVSAAAEDLAEALVFIKEVGEEDQWPKAFFTRTVAQVLSVRDRAQGAMWLPER